MIILTKIIMTNNENILWGPFWHRKNFKNVFLATRCLYRGVMFSCFLSIKRNYPKIPYQTWISLSIFIRQEFTFQVFHALQCHIQPYFFLFLFLILSFPTPCTCMYYFETSWLFINIKTQIYSHYLRCLLASYLLPNIPYCQAQLQSTSTSTSSWKLRLPYYSFLQPACPADQNTTFLNCTTKL